MPASFGAAAQDPKSDAALAQLTAELAAEIIGRIRVDEEIHVRSLNIYLGELRSVTFRTAEGGTVGGAELIDRFWSGLVHWATVDQPKLVAERQYEEIKERILAHEDGARILAEFDALADPGFQVAAGVNTRADGRTLGGQVLELVQEDQRFEFVEFRFG